MKTKLNAYLARFKQSKFLVFVIGMTIGISYTYLYIAGSEYYDWAKIGYEYSHEFLDSKEAEASEVSRTQGEVVQTATHQGIETPVDNISIDSLIKNSFGSQSEMAIAIAKAESNMEADRIGDTHITFVQDGKTYGMSCGVFQIRTLPGRPTCEEMLDPEKNIKFAYELYQKSGWTPWSVFTNGQYKKFLN
jgi:hypothetical protein